MKIWLVNENILYYSAFAKVIIVDAVTNSGVVLFFDGRVEKEETKIYTSSVKIIKKAPSIPAAIGFKDTWSNKLNLWLK